MKYIRIFSLLGEYVPLGIGALKASTSGPAFSKIKSYTKRRSRNAMCFSNVNFRRRPRTRTAATSEALSWQCEKSYIKNHHPFKAIIPQEDRTDKTQTRKDTLERNSNTVQQNTENTLREKMALTRGGIKVRPHKKLLKCVEYIILSIGGRKNGYNNFDSGIYRTGHDM